MSKNRFYNGDFNVSYIVEQDDFIGNVANPVEIVNGWFISTDNPLTLSTITSANSSIGELQFNLSEDEFSTFRLYQPTYIPRNEALVYFFEESNPITISTSLGGATDSLIKGNLEVRPFARWASDHHTDWLGELVYGDWVDYPDSFDRYGSTQFSTTINVPQTPHVTRPYSVAVDTYLITGLQYRLKTQEKFPTERLWIMFMHLDFNTVATEHQYEDVGIATERLLAYAESFLLKGSTTAFMDGPNNKLGITTPDSKLKARGTGNLEVIINDVVVGSPGVRLRLGTPDNLVNLLPTDTYEYFGNLINENGKINWSTNILVDSTLGADITAKFGNFFSIPCFLGVYLRTTCRVITPTSLDRPATVIEE